MRCFLLIEVILAVIVPENAALLLSLQSHEPNKTPFELSDETITVVSRGAKVSLEPKKTPLQLSDEAITVVSRGAEAYGDRRKFSEKNESVKGGLQSRPEREFVVAAEKAAKEPPSASSSISPDINELEEALKELARLSKEVKDVAISDSVSFIGDYRDGMSPIDGAVERKRRGRRRRRIREFEMRKRYYMAAL
ncbi:unnamed protein product [Haemonchus placei]|uniref:Uncharacterized protein n=1 Tax=Haemonchus placei TaxID=6290 RepID=A0A0N4WHP0_HAEPC|nr:unnamed protein product [Haemonchus placei]